TYGFYGDPDFVRVVATSQYLSRYVFFTDPIYPETNLVITRKRGANGFADVKLDCAGALAGWTAVTPDYEWTRIDLVRHDFEPQGSCDNGVHEMVSTEPFSVSVWGWGSDETTTLVTASSSYGFPAGEGVRFLSNAIVPPVPK